MIANTTDFFSQNSTSEGGLGIVEFIAPIDSPLDGGDVVRDGSMVHEDIGLSHVDCSHG